MTEFQPTTISEVKTVIMGAPSSSCEQDPIPTSLIKEFVDDFAPYLTKIVNLSLSTGTIPSCLQHAIVKPLLKKSNLEKQQLKNYRPIANLKYISKVIERVTSARLTACISDQNLQNPFQSAYRKSHSVETALIKVQNDILVSMDGGKIVGIVLLDLNSAFDTVDHPVLINRLSYVGVRGTALQWFHSYLSSRSQSVQIRDTSSPSTAMNFSVPQGSVLGPHLFNIYTLPLQNIIAKHNLKVHMYADDLQLSFTCSPVQEEVDKCLESLQTCICDIRKWMSDSYLKLNNDKTEFLMLGSIGSSLEK